MDTILIPGISQYFASGTGLALAKASGFGLLARIVGGLILGIAVLFVLTRVPPKYRKWSIMAVTFVAGLFYSIEYLWPGDNYLTPYIQPLGGDWLPVIGTFALGLGIWNLMHIHGRNIAKRKPGWSNSMAFYLALISMTILGIAQDYIPTTAAGKESIYTLLYNILFVGMLAPLGATMFSIIAFYIVSAAYRAFRIRSWESALMMLAAFLVMLGPVPVAQLLTNGIPMDKWTSIFRLEHISFWIMTVPNTAAQRGMGFGIGVGALAMALRIWLSLERGSYFDKQI